MGSLEDLLMCSVCIERYHEKERQPVLLPRCGHSFCRTCVAMLVSSGCIVCPTCRTDQRIECVDRLPTEYTLLAIINAQESYKKETCEQHQVKLSFWCRTCNKAACGECLFEDHPTHRHKILRSTQYISDMKKNALDITTKFFDDLNRREDALYRIIFHSTKIISSSLKSIRSLRKDIEDARHLIKSTNQDATISSATALHETAKFLGLKWNIQDANNSHGHYLTVNDHLNQPEDEIDIEKAKIKEQMKYELEQQENCKLMITNGIQTDNNGDETGATENKQLDKDVDSKESDHDVKEITKKKTKKLSKSRTMSSIQNMDTDGTEEEKIERKKKSFVMEDLSELKEIERALEESIKEQELLAEEIKKQEIKLSKKERNGKKLSKKKSTIAALSENVEVQTKQNSLIESNTTICEAKPENDEVKQLENDHKPISENAQIETKENINCEIKDSKVHDNINCINDKICTDDIQKDLAIVKIESKSIAETKTDKQCQTDNKIYSGFANGVQSDQTLNQTLLSGAKLSDYIQVLGFMICVEGPNGRLGQITWGEQGLHVHSLQFQQVDYDIVITNSLFDLLTPTASPSVFLEISTEKTVLGTVYIKLWGSLRRAYNFLSLCLGNQGESYINTNFIQVYNIGCPGERILGGDYEFNSGKGGKGVLADLEWNDDYTMPMKAGMITAAGLGQGVSDSMFIICTQSDLKRNFSCPFGMVFEGLDLVKQAVKLSATNQVYISDCGVLINPPEN